MRKFDPTEVTFTLSAVPDDVPLKGNVMASGDDAADREAEDAVRADLEAGNVWAWASVTVTAKWAGFEGTDNLGGCSYKDEADFREGGYYDDMLAESLADLISNIEDAGWEIEVSEADKAKAVELGKAA